MKETYDIFISYNRSDRAEVEEIAKILRDKHGISVFFDLWEIQPGDIWQKAIQEALQKSKHILIFIGASGIGKWESEEERVALSLSLDSSTEKRLIPVLLTGSDPKTIPPFLSQRTWLDLRNENGNEYQIYRLLMAIKPKSDDDQMRLLGKLFEIPPKIKLEVKLLGNYLDFDASQKSTINLFGKIESIKTSDDTTIISTTTDMASLDEFENLVDIAQEQMEQLRIINIKGLDGAGGKANWNKEDNKVIISHPEASKQIVKAKQAKRRGKQSLFGFSGIQPLTVDSRRREIFLKRISKLWIEDTLERGLYALARIALEVVNDQSIIFRPNDRVLNISDQYSIPLSNHTKIVDIFLSAPDGLLILGKPGTGKTVTLLELLQELLNIARKNNTFPIPIALNLSSWTKSKLGFERWLLDEVYKLFHIPELYMLNWLKNDEVLLLLDGLDEVKQDHRESCVNAINKFRAAYGFANLIVCCRLEDYENLPEKLEVRAKVIIQPLSQHRIQEYLCKAGDKLSSVRQAMINDAILREIANTPLMLHVMTVAYQGKELSELKEFASIADRRKHLFDTYIEMMFVRIGRQMQQEYPYLKAREWLSNLAQIMQTKREWFLSLERIQPDWLVRPLARIKYIFIKKASIGLMFFTLFYLLALSLGNVTSQMLRIISIGALAFGLFDARVQYLRTLQPFNDLKKTLEISPIENIKWDKKLFFGMIGSWAIFVPACLWINGDFSLLFKNPKFVLIFYLVLVSISIPLSFRVDIGDARDRQVKQGIRKSLNNFLIMSGLMTTIVCALGFLFFPILQGYILIIFNSVFPFAKLYTDVTAGLHSLFLISIIIGIITGLNFGGFPVFQHYILMYIFWLEGLLPLNLEKFLDFTSERILTIKSGGGYKFVHRMLLEHLASNPVPKVHSDNT